MKRWLNTGIIATSPIAILGLVVAAWVFVISPFLSNYLKSQLPKINSSQDFVIVDFEKIDISLLKLQAIIKNPLIKFRKEKFSFSDIKAEKVLAQIDPFKLLIGQIEVSHIILEDMSWTLDYSQLPKTESNADLPLDEFFKILPEIPVRRLILKNTDFTYSSEKTGVAAKVNSSLLIVGNLKKLISINLDETTVLLQNQKHPPVSLVVHSSLELDNQRLKLNKFNIKTGESEFEVSGYLSQFKKIKTSPQGDLAFKGKILGENIRDSYLAWYPQKNRFPVLRGLVDINGKINFKDIDHTNGQIAITTHDISVDHFRFGNAKILSTIKDNQLQFEQVHIEHPAGVVELKNVKIEQKSPYNFQTDLELKEFDLQKLFLSLGLNQIPAGLNSTGQLNCQGQLTEGLRINCKVQLDTNQVWVKPSLSDHFYIAKIPKARLDGNVQLTETDVKFSSKINLPNSEGNASGYVHFEKGFRVDFLSDKLDLNDVEDLAGLNMRGLFKLKGTTYGDSEFGKIDAQVIATDLSVDRFQLGFLTTQVRYDSTKLYLEDLLGKLNKTSYAGQMQFDFKKSTLLGLIKLLHIEGEDLITALNKRFDIPFSLSGKGQVEVEVSGPFDFWKLNYDLKAQLLRGAIADESFENLNLHLVSNGKFIQFINADLKKVHGSANLTGVIQTDPQQIFDLRFKTNQLAVEEIDHVAKLFPNMNGQVSLDGAVQGPLEDPLVKTLFNAKKINFDGMDYSDSSGELSIDKKNFQMRGQIMGRQIQTDLKWPWDPNGDFFFKTQLRDLSLFSFLPAVSLPLPPSDYYSRMSAEVDLKGNKRSLDQTNGYIKLNDLVLQRGVHILKLTKPAELTFEKGIKKADILMLSGEGNSLIVKPQFKNTGTQFYIEADLQLRLFQFLAPFLDSLSGQLTVNTSLTLNRGQLQMLGEGHISNTFVKLKGFSVPIEDIESPIQFSQSKIILDDITALIGTRDLYGSGFIDFKGANNILVDLNAEAENLEITFPEKITTSGKVNLRFSGDWLPYTLKVDYKVSDGLVEKDFGQGDRSGTTVLSMSPYLPQSQITERSASVKLDVDVDLTNGVVVKNQLIHGDARGQLNISGSPEQPQIVGRIEIDKGSQLFFRDKSFVIDNAVINFTPGREINPTIYITANSRIAEYDINLLVQGPSKNIQIKPTSQPPLTENDIFSLLALGYTTQADQTLSSEAQQRQAGIEAIATLTNQSEFNKKIENTFGLTVQLAPSIDSTKNIAVPKVVVSKQLQKKLNASYSRPLSGDNLTNEFKLQYLFNPNFSVNLNYQNSERNQQENIQNYNQNENGILGSDVEYKLEFK